WPSNSLKHVGVYLQNRQTRLSRQMQSQIGCLRQPTKAWGPTYKGDVMPPRGTRMSGSPLVFLVLYPCIHPHPHWLIAEYACTQPLPCSPFYHLLSAVTEMCVRLPCSSKVCGI